jgi:hypothetical protein
MKASTVMLGLVFTAGMIHQVAGKLECGVTTCTACWIDKNKGTDTKVSCPKVGTWEGTLDRWICNACPPGSNQMHCSEKKRCL